MAAHELRPSCHKVTLFSCEDMIVAASVGYSASVVGVGVDASQALI